MTKNNIIILVISIIIAIIITNSFNKKYRTLLQTTIENYEFELDSLLNENVELAESRDGLLLHVGRYKDSLNYYMDSLEYYRNNNEDDYEEIINASDSSNIELFYSNIERYKERLDISINR